MQKGDIIELVIESVGMDGEGVARTDGMVVFVPFTLVGEVVKCQIVFVKKKFAKAKVIKLIKASDLRQEPLCPHFRKCGGCDMQHIVYDRQLEIKKENVENCFKKYSDEIVDVQEVIPSDKQYYYRNKAQFPLFTHNGKVQLGFYQEKSHNFVAIEKCYLQDDWCDKFANAFLKVANRLKLTTYNEQNHTGFLRHLVLRKLNDKVCITIVVNDKVFKYSQDFIKEFEKIGTKFSMFVSYNTKRTNLIMYNAEHKYGEENIQTEILGVRTFVNPLSFMQINDYIRDKIYTKVQNIIANDKAEIVVDAYSGVGVLTNIIAKSAKKVYGVEIVPEAVENANKLAIINGNQDKITNVCGDSAIEVPKILADMQEKYINECQNAIQMHLVEDAFTKIKNGTKVYEIRLNDEKRQTIKTDDFIKFINVETRETMLTKVKSIAKFDTFTDMCEQIDNKLLGFNDSNMTENAQAMYKYYSAKDEEKYGVLAIEIEVVANNFTVVLDPPRKGCDELVLQSLLKALPTKIIYISCNPSTLARDYVILKEKYKLTLVQPYDMFPNTSHVETLVKLVRKNTDTKSIL